MGRREFLESLKVEVPNTAISNRSGQNSEDGEFSTGERERTIAHTTGWDRSEESENISFDDSSVKSQETGMESEEKEEMSFDEGNNDQNIESQNDEAEEEISGEIEQDVIGGIENEADISVEDGMDGGMEM